MALRKTWPLMLAAVAVATAQQTPPAAPAAPPVTLHLGDAAPPLTVVKWLKGTPQTRLDDGKVRVIEFWATWCGPCKVGMPHLSELAKRYGDKVAFVGVDASERADDVTKPEAFVKRAGDMMAYNVAYATPRGAMTNDWMKAAGQNGIPCCFVVDKQGKIGWIGHPLMGLEEALALATQDKLTPDAAKKIDAQWEANLKAGEETMKKVEELQKAGKVDEALAANDTFATQWPFAAPDTVANRYALLSAKDPAAAKAYGDSVLKEKPHAPYVLRAVADSILNEKSDVKGTRDYALAKALYLKANDTMDAGPGTAMSLAKAEFALGNKAEAAKRQAEAVAMIDDIIKGYPDTPQGKQAKESAQKVRDMAQADLEKYQKGG